MLCGLVREKVCKRSIQRSLLCALGLCLIVAAFEPAHAQTPGIGLEAIPIATRPAISATTRAIEERDQLIESLRQRIEALEARLDAPAVKPAAYSAPLQTPMSAPNSEGITLDTVERALERSLVRSGALLLPSGVIEIDTGATYVREESQGAALGATPDGAAMLGSVRFGRDVITLDVGARVGLPFDTQLEVSVPFRRVEEAESILVGNDVAIGEGEAAGLGDVRIGLAKTLAREDGWRPDIIARVAWDTATGRAVDNGIGLGGGFHELSAGVTFLKRQDPLVFVVGANYGWTLERDDVKPGDRFDIALSTLLAVSPETSLRLGFSGGYESDVDIGGRTLSASDRRFATLNLGASGALGQAVFLDFGLSVGLTEDSPDFALTISTPIRVGAPFRN